MIHPSIIKFYSLLLYFETDVIFELQNCMPYYELIKYSNFENGFRKEFDLNTYTKYFGLDETSFIIFKPSADYGKSTYIAVDATGKIYQLLFEPGHKYSKRELSGSIFDLIKTSKISIQKLPSVYSIIKYDLSKFPVDERFEFGYLMSIVRNSLLKNPNIKNLDTSISQGDNSALRSLDIKFIIGEKMISISLSNVQFKEGFDSIGQFINLLNQELSSIENNHKFAIVHENKWDALHALVFVDLSVYDELMRNELTINYL